MKVFKKILLWLFIVAGLALMGFILFCIITATQAKLDPDKLQLQTQTVRICDLNGNELSGSNEHVAFGDIPPHVVNAFVAIEDKRFFDHSGVDYKRIAGAAWHNLKNHTFSEGGSTITQQLIKNTHLNREKTFSRKIQEIKLAYDLERRYSKQEILTLYLNKIYYGNGIYGIANAARYYFGKPVSELKLEEGAWLAAVIKAPTAYTNLVQTEKGLTRKNLVLSLMAENGFISEGQKDIAIRAELLPGKHGGSAQIPQDYLGKVIDEACAALQCTENELSQCRLTIYTYLNLESQNRLHTLLEPLKKDSFDMSCVVLDNTSRGIVSYYNSRNQEIRRQPGSVIKPLLSYAAALEYNKISPLTPVLDEPCKFGDYEPKNYQNNYSGYINMRTALAKSSNVVAVKALEYVGVENGIAVAGRLGIPFADEDKHLAIALGGFTYGVTPQEVAAGYASLAGGGEYGAAGYISHITDQNGDIVYADLSARLQAVREDTAFLLTDMLKGVVQNGTAKKLGALPFDVAAKTGTVGFKTGNSDAWAAAYTSRHTIVVWCGKADGGVMRDNVLGGTVPCEAIRQYFAGQYYENAPAPFAVAPGVEKLSVDRWEYEVNHVLKLASADAPKSERLEDYFSETFRPTEVSSRYRSPSVGRLTIAVEGGRMPVIQFDAEPIYTYRFIRRDIFGREQDVASISGRSGTVTVRDSSARRAGFYEYFVEIQWPSQDGILQSAPPVSVGKVRLSLFA